MEIKTLSSAPGVPFNDTLERFFEKYNLSEDVECYQFYFCPWGNYGGTNFDDLYKLNFKSKIVILNVIDTIIDIDDNTAIKEIVKFCRTYPEHNFIISSPHLNLQREFTKRNIVVPNLYLDQLLCTTHFSNFKRCEKKGVKANKWLCLNSGPRVHRVLAMSYLLSKDYSDNGDFTFDLETELVKQPYQYKNLRQIPDHLKGSFSEGYEKFKQGKFNRLDITKFDYRDLNPTENYNEILAPICQSYGVEIITGTMFFEKTPVLSEKEMQSVWSQTFPIYINGVGIVRELKNIFGLDLFEDIVDHSYDEIENHFERMTAAIDRNQHLLDGSTNIQELWYDNRERFESNCNKMESMLCDSSYQKNYNFSRLRKAFTHFNVTVTLI